jgi:hypothetical protein
MAAAKKSPPEDINSNSKSWKSRLISSSLPLEFEAARILISEKFHIQSDYTYLTSPQ